MSDPYYKEEVRLEMFRALPEQYGLESERGYQYDIGVRVSANQAHSISAFNTGVLRCNKAKHSDVARAMSYEEEVADLLAGENGAAIENVLVYTAAANAFGANEEPMRFTIGEAVSSVEQSAKLSPNKIFRKLFL